MREKNKRKISFLIALCLIFISATALCSCSDRAQDVPLECSISYTVKESASSVTERDGALQVSADRTERIVVIYSVSAECEAALCSFELALEADGELGRSDSITVVKLSDANTQQLSPSSVKREDSRLSQKQVMSFDGVCEFEVTYTVSGDSMLYPPIVREITADGDYTVAEGGAVRMVLLREDMKEYGITRKEAAALCSELDSLRASIRKLCGGYEPSGRTDIVFTENSSYTALAGDPIYVNNGELERFFTPTEGNVGKTDGVAILCHEISHTFDRENYCFDRELFAALKQIYALSDNGYPIDYDFLMDTPSLSGGAYSYEVFLRRILEKTDALSNFARIEQCMAELISMEDGCSRIEKLDRFIGNISAGDPSTLFSESELSLVRSAYSGS